MDDLEKKRSHYVRVSDVIGKQTERQMRTIPIETLANACLRGITIHKYCTTYLKCLYPPDYEPEYKPYIEEFIRWVDKNVDHLIYSDIRLYDDQKEFTGEFDAIVKLKNSKRTALIDIKTSATSSLSWPVQLAAYEHLCLLNGYNIDEAFNIHLKRIKPAKYEIINGERIMISPPVVVAKKEMKEDLKPYLQIFTSSLICHRYFENAETNHVEL